MEMARKLRAIAASALLIAASVSGTAFAEKPGGVLRIPVFDNPASMSIHEESAVLAERAMMGVFNNLVIFDQHVKQNSMQSIVPDLATSWNWNEDGTELTLPLREGVEWHDGKPFTAGDVKCTWDLLTDKSGEKLRVNPRKSWYRNLNDVTTAGSYAVTFHLKRPQPAFLALLASGWSPVYTCHIPPREMRSHPIGTGPFKFIGFKPNESIKVARNPHYWKKNRPYLDAIEFTIIPNTSTRMLGFIAGKFDMITLQPPQLKEVKSQTAEAICDLVPDNAARNLIVNRAAPPFDNPDLRRAMTLSLDRKAFNDIINEGQGKIGGVMQPLAEGLWGMPPEVLATLPGYDPDIAKNRAEARKIMETLGYGPDKRLAVAVSTRNVAGYRDPAVILIDQLKEVYIDGELKPLDTTQWYPMLARKDYKVAVNVTETAVDDPDPTFYENYVCGAQRNYTGYCNPEVDKLIDQQSAESDVNKRKQLVWEIERKLAEDDARPILFYPAAAYCRKPEFKGFVAMVNSIYNNSRFEDLWLDK
jgi:peptide/nickel transport system substrate-binding protein